MKYIKKVIIWVMIVMLLVVPAQAISINNILECNQSKSEQWVNWYPSGWTSVEDIKDLAEQLVQEAGGREAAPLRIHNWICEHICYDWDAFNTGIYSTLSAEQVLAERRGVCEGIANLVQALFLESGIPCIKVWGVAITEEESWSETDLSLDHVNHTWNEFYIDGRWASLDCTMDIRNRYEDGIFSFSPWRTSYFDPSEEFFAQTHLRLQRGFDLPENIPDSWAKAEVKKAVDLNLVPLSFLEHYQAPVTERELFTLLGRDSGDNRLLNRLQAATLLAPLLGDSLNKSPPYQDTGQCTFAEQVALAMLYQYGIMEGSSGCFYPEEYLTRQEAIAILVRLFYAGE